MKKTLLLSLLALVFTFALPWLRRGAPTEREPEPTAPPPAADEPLPAPTAEIAAEKAPRTVVVLTDAGEREMDLQDYLTGVVAAEMPASFAAEALKAQAVAARSYALCQMRGAKHGTAQLCTDFRCCQAWKSDEALRAQWGARYEENLARVRAAVEETDGEYLAWEGQPALALFHASSAGATEDCGELWSARPYLVSVSSPETAADVPDYVSYVQCTALDFRDTILSACPDADFSGPPEDWLGPLSRDGSGRVSACEIGGASLSGAKLRELFALRSTAFTLECVEGGFRFTVIGHGHGVGMSQYGAQVMALSGADYREILAHYYPGTALVK